MAYRTLIEDKIFGIEGKTMTSFAFEPSFGKLPYRNCNQSCPLFVLPEEREPFDLLGTTAMRRTVSFDGPVSLDRWWRHNLLKR